MSDGSMMELQQAVEDGGAEDFTSFGEVSFEEPVVEEEGVIDEPRGESEAGDEASFEEVSTDEPKVEEPEEEIKDEPKAEEEKPEEVDAEVSGDDGQLLTGRLGEEDVQVSQNATFPVKIDGEVQDIPLKDLVSDFSGRQAIDKRFSELNVEKVQYTKERDELLNKLVGFAEASEKGNTMEAIQHLADLAGKDAWELTQSIKKQILENAKDYVNADETTQKYLDNEEKIKYYEQREARREQNAEISKSQEEAATEISSFQQKYGLDDRGVVELYDSLVAKSPDLPEIGVEQLERFLVESQTQDKAVNLLSKVDPTLSENQDYISDIRDFIQANPDMDEDSIVATIQEVFGTEEPKTEGKSATEVVKERAKASSPSKKKVVEVDEDDYDLISFDEVDSVDYY
jgi:hypothetical protein